MIDELKIQFHGLLNSYSQIYFAKRKWFALLILLASFVDPVVGMAGMASILFANIFASLMGFNRSMIHDGMYAYNSLLVGLGIGLNFEPNMAFFIIIFFASVFSFLFTVWMLGKFSFWQIPIGSFCFVAVSWIVILASRNYHQLEISERGIFLSNELWKIGGSTLVTWYEKINTYPLHPVITMYLKSMGAVIFQSNMISGFIITLGLLIHSRIAFSLSVIGFLSGYFFYMIIGGSMAELEYGYIGFNFILTSIAVGGFFLIPSPSSYLLVIILTPLNAILIAASVKFLDIWQLPVLSLPFNIVLFLSIYALKLRVKSKFLQPVSIQHFSPEKNLYYFKNSLNRFAKNTYIHISLPFFGEWNVSQGYFGNITHKGEWAHALDFDIVDEDNNTYKMPGKNIEDFYCFKLPVVAPADGWIEEVVDHIEDNKIGDVNLNNTNNWGNTVVIRHAYGLYTKLSHLMQFSVLYPKGTFVKKGDIVAYCGSSGRSPEPHLHFQLQTTPYIGARTLNYPLAYYITREDKEYHFKSFDVPLENEKISNVFQTTALKNAYSFILGSIHEFTYVKNGIQYTEKWEVMVDIYNAMYLYSHETGASAWFVNDGTLFYFTSYEGSKKTLLYYFYLCSYKVVQGYYKNLNLDDEYPLILFNDIKLQWIDDFISPFYFIKKASFQLKYIHTDDEIDPHEIRLESTATLNAWKIKLRELKFQIEIKNNSIESFIVYKNGEEFIHAQKYIAAN